MLTRLRHPNLVCIMGMCHEGNQKLGVFEFMPKGSLRDLLDKKVVTWKDRVTIAIGSARGLAYLHEISQPPVIHCDFKSTNVLIDQYGQAHVADFGLARHIGGYRPPIVSALVRNHMQMLFECILHFQLMETSSGTLSDTSNPFLPFRLPVPPLPPRGPRTWTTVTSIRGTYGYLSPEYLEKGHASVRADIFAFGVVLLELLTGRQPVDTLRGRGMETLGDWLRPHLRNPDQMLTMMDPAVSEQASAVQVAVMCEIAEACLRPNPRERPSMLDVVRTLSAVSNFSESSQKWQPDIQVGESRSSNGGGVKASSLQSPPRRSHLPSHPSPPASGLPPRPTILPKPESVNPDTLVISHRSEGMMANRGRLSGIVVNHQSGAPLRAS